MVLFLDKDKIKTSGGKAEFVLFCDILLKASHSINISYPSKTTMYNHFLSYNLGHV